jgi:hypothetical protein
MLLIRTIRRISAALGMCLTWTGKNLELIGLVSSTVGWRRFSTNAAGRLSCLERHSDLLKQRDR